MFTIFTQELLTNKKGVEVFSSPWYIIQLVFKITVAIFNHDFIEFMEKKIGKKNNKTISLLKKYWLIKSGVDCPCYIKQLDTSLQDKSYNI